MKALLKFLYFLLFVVIAILLAGLFFPKDMTIKSKTRIHAPMEIVFNQVNRLQNWENWSPWLKKDPSVPVVYNNISHGVGAEFSWANEKSDAGSLKILQSLRNKEIVMKISFGEQGDADMDWKFSEEEGKVEVTWIFESTKMGYFERYFMFLFRKPIQHDLDQGLHNLKEVCEELRLSRISAIEVKEMEAQPAMIIIDSARVNNMNETMKALFKKLAAYLVKRNIKAAGNPFTIFFKWNPDSFTTFAVGYPIPEKTWGWREYSYFELPAGKAVSVIHWGRYNSEKPYREVEKYITNHNLKRDSLIWEVYVKSPEEEPDTTLWEKRVYYPLVP